ncbi:uncharacterized protein SPPG_04906 [Spizellomyces punctatus DAOM BR117]|uniref:Ras-GEF domain-containing protein n=1 Tax=Spizellomyces punctatus (strain DAOM BR117) TaxID=645134 RepID=A0A0L0HDG0_SPIPD|nr:uncharacterized protein SPPG_04906 [Spizellomyces punctatus DAOM BR117]KNC99515.1 hypothetical protein SPPG_04906 [Spizellomyces punctatus DAOM BR117]|eukprot:XP_016607555.1 hypothetical protein SPPG_04906 [Spizellomyces punctatus DAOM BR117]
MHAIRSAAADAASKTVPKDSYFAQLKVLNGILLQLKSAEFTSDGRPERQDDRIELLGMCRQCIDTMEGVLRQADGRSQTKQPKAGPSLPPKPKLTIQPITDRDSIASNPFMDASEHTPVNDKQLTSVAAQNSGTGPPPQISLSSRESDDLFSPYSPRPSGSNGSTLENPKPKHVRPWASPDIPPSPLLVQYRELNSQLYEAMGRPGLEKGPSSASLYHDGEEHPTTPQRLESAPTHRRSLSDGATTVRSKLARVIYQILLAASAANVTTFRPVVVAFELCLIDQKIFDKLRPADMINHRPPNNPSPSVHASTEFFNYLTRMIEFSILEPVEAGDRAVVIHSWTKVAWNLYQLRNLQSLKAIVSALGTPPIARLKRTWGLVPKKSMTTLEQLRELLSEQNNYTAYREWLARSVTRPMVPFLGVYMHDITYLLALAKKDGTSPASDKRLKEIFDQMEFYQAGQKYAYEQLTALLRLEKKSGALGFKKQQKSGISSRAPPELLPLREADDETVGQFVGHWILSRKWYTEKEMDALSLAREPRHITESTTPNSSNSTPLSQIVIEDVMSEPIPDFGGSGYDYLAANNIAVPPEFFGGVNAASILSELKQNRKRMSAGAMLMEALKGSALSFGSKKQASIPRRRSMGAVNGIAENVATASGKSDVSGADDDGRSSVTSSSSEWSLSSLKSLVFEGEEGGDKGRDGLDGEERYTDHGDGRSSDSQSITKQGKPSLGWLSTELKSRIEQMSTTPPGSTSNGTTSGSVQSPASEASPRTNKRQQNRISAIFTGFVGGGASSNNSALPEKLANHAETHAESDAFPSNHRNVSGKRGFGYVPGSPSSHISSLAPSSSRSHRRTQSTPHARFTDASSDAQAHTQPKRDLHKNHLAGEADAHGPPPRPIPPNRRGESFNGDPFKDGPENHVPRIAPKSSLSKAEVLHEDGRTRSQSHPPPPPIHQPPPRPPPPKRDAPTPHPASHASISHAPASHSPASHSLSSSHSGVSHSVASSHSHPIPSHAEHDESGWRKQSSTGRWTLHQTGSDKGYQGDAEFRQGHEPKDGGNISSSTPTTAPTQRHHRTPTPFKHPPLIPQQSTHQQSISHHPPTHQPASYHPSPQRLLRPEDDHIKRQPHRYTWTPTTAAPTIPRSSERPTPSAPPAVPPKPPGMREAGREAVGREPPVVPPKPGRRT